MKYLRTHGHESRQTGFIESYVFKIDALKGGKYEFIRCRNKQNFKRDLTKLIFSLTGMQVS